MGLKEKIEEFKKKHHEKEEKRKEDLIDKKIIKRIVASGTQEEQAETIVTAVTENPRFRKKIVEKVDEADEIPQEVMDRAAKIAAKSKTVSYEVTVEISEKASAETTLEVLKNETIPVDQRIELAETINSKEQQIEASYINIKRLYNTLNELVPQEELVRKIKALLLKSKKTDKELHQIYKVLAKNSAILYHERNKALNMRSMEQVAPLDELIRAGMPKMIEEEYMCLLDENEESKFDLDEVTNRFLKREAQRVVRKAKNTGASVGSIVQNMGDLSEEKVEYFLEELSKNNENLTDLDLEIVKHKLSGIEQDDVKGLIQEAEASVSKEKKKDIVKLLNKLNKKELEILNNCIESGFIETLKDCIESGLIKNLSTKTEEERKAYLNAINSSIKKRELMKKAKTAKKISRKETPKIKKAEFKDNGREIE